MKKVVLVVVLLFFCSTTHAFPYTINSGWQSLSFDINKPHVQGDRAGIWNLEGSFEFKVNE